MFSECKLRLRCLRIKMVRANLRNAEKYTIGAGTSTTCDYQSHLRDSNAFFELLLHGTTLMTIPFSQHLCLPIFYNLAVRLENVLFLHRATSHDDQEWGLEHKIQTPNIRHRAMHYTNCFVEIASMVWIQYYKMPSKLSSSKIKRNVDVYIVLPTSRKRILPLRTWLARRYPVQSTRVAHAILPTATITPIIIAR